MNLIVLVAIITSASASTIGGSRGPSTSEKCVVDSYTRYHAGSSPSPLYLVSGINRFAAIKRYGIMEYDKGKSLELVCNAIGGFSAPGPAKGQKSITISCDAGTRFKYGETSTDISDFRCKEWPVYSKRDTGKTCFGGQGKLYEAGFKIDPVGEVQERFVVTYTSCYNDDTKESYYSKYSMGAGSNNPEIGHDTAGLFRQNDETIDRWYTKGNQIAKLKTLYGGTPAAKKTFTDSYIVDSMNRVLNRGHYAANKDFVMVNQQRSTYQFINAAPQWKMFNQENWNRIEEAIRLKATECDKQFQVFSGSYGQLTITNAAGNNAAVNLGDGNQLPVPLHFFKILIENSSSRGIVLLGFNDAHKNKEEAKAMFLCDDVSDKVRFVKWTGNTMRNGVVYACTIKSFLDRVTELQGAFQYSEKKLPLYDITAGNAAASSSRNGEGSPNRGGRGG